MDIDNDMLNKFKNDKIIIYKKKYLEFDELLHDNKINLFSFIANNFFINIYIINLNKNKTLISIILILLYLKLYFEKGFRLNFIKYKLKNINFYQNYFNKIQKISCFIYIFNILFNIPLVNKIYQFFLIMYIFYFSKINKLNLNYKIYYFITIYKYSFIFLKIFIQLKFLQIWFNIILIVLSLNIILKLTFFINIYSLDIEDYNYKKLMFILFNNLFSFILLNIFLVYYCLQLTELEKYIIFYIYECILLTYIFIFKFRFKVFEDEDEDDEDILFQPIQNKINIIFIKPFIYKLNLFVKSNNYLTKIYTEYDLNDISLKCIICYTNQSSILLLPCYHLIFCNECIINYIKFNLLKCPLCKIIIDNFITIKINSQNKEIKQDGQIFIN